MDRGRAEIHLRLVAEAELHRATAYPPDAAATAPNLPGAWDGALLHSQRSAVVAALYDLPGRQRELIALRYYAGLSDAETAAAAHISLGAANAHTAHGVAALRAALETDTTRVRWVARVLIAVGALQPEVADQILADFTLALEARRAGSPGRPSPDPRSLLRSPVAHVPLGMLMTSRLEAFPRTAGGSCTVAAARPGPVRPPATPHRVVPVGLMIPVRAAGVNGRGEMEDFGGEMHLLSYARTTAGAWFTTIVQARGGEFVPPGIEHSGMFRPAAIFPVDQFMAADDRGTRYRMGFKGRRGRRPTELTGEITLHPVPTAGIRWLDLSTVPDEPAVRIDLNPGHRPPAIPEVTDSQAAASPGEHLLHHVATRLLLLTLAFPQEIWLHPAAYRKAPVPCTADGLGDLIAALQACGAMSLLSPVPGQLAALCAILNISGHGITAPPAGDLPAPWLSMLAYFHRRKPHTAPGGAGWSALTSAFPELDGIGLAVLGLHNSAAGTVLYVHASGMTLDPRTRLPNLGSDLCPAIWLRDSGGCWHATRVGTWNAEHADGVTMHLEVVPPLSRTASWVEVLAAGSSAQSRTTLPLRWQ
jgi:sigma-70-like protein